MRGWAIGVLTAVGVLLAVAFAWRSSLSPRVRRLAGLAGRVPDAEAGAPLAIELSGCGAIRASRRCLVASKARFRLVVVGSTGPITMELDGRPISPLAVTVGRSELGDATGHLEVRVGEARAAVEIGRLERPRWYDEATAARARGEVETAEKLAEEALASRAETEERALAVGLLARIALRRGATDRAAGLFRESIALGRAAGLISESADDAFALSYLLHQRARRFAEARAVLDAIAPALGDYADGLARERFYRAELAWETGDARTALHLLAAASARAETLGHVSLSRAVGHLRAMVLCQAGSIDECRSSLAMAERELATAPDVTACERVEVAVSLGFAELSAAMQKREAPPDLGSADERALAITACPDTQLRGNAFEHLALVSALKKEPAAARARLAESRRAIAEPRLSDVLFWTEVEAQIAASEGNYAVAVATFAAEERLAEASDMKREAWRARVGRADALEAKGDIAGALAAHREAERTLDDHVLVVPLAEGRSAVSAESDRATARAIELALRTHDDAGALFFVRSSRARLVRSVARGLRIEGLAGDERKAWDDALATFRSGRDEIDDEAAGDWKLSASSLATAAKKRATRLATLRAGLDDALARVGIRAISPPDSASLEEGELGLAYVEIPSGRVGFAFDRHGIVSARVRGTEPVQLLEPFRAAIERARTISVFASGRLAALDLHAVVLDGRPLLARAPVVYPLDLGSLDLGSEGQPSSAAPAVTLVVADPTGDLPGARAEAREVANRARASGEVMLFEDERATSARVRGALEKASLLHYSGHGTFGGPAGTESLLPLAAGGSLSIADILALPHAPRDVVLSGCEAARTYDGREEGLGLAQAFLVAGARSVIAPTRVVGDTLARAIGLGLLDAPPSDTLPAKLRFSQLRANERGVPGWESFRALAR